MNTLEHEPELQIDPETGEILEVSNAPEAMDEKYALWVLDKLLDCHVQMASARRTKAEAVATLDFMESAVLDELRSTPEYRKYEIIRDNSIATIEANCKRSDGLLARFGDQLREWTKPLLKGKSKTHKTPIGSIQVKAPRVKFEVSDDDRALEFARSVGAVKVVEKVMVSEIPDELSERLTTDRTFAESNGFRIVETPESIEVKF